METESKKKVLLREDVVFGKGGGRDLKCDVFTPPSNPQNAPAILLIHGGAWKYGDRKQLRGYGFLIGREGYVCVATEYRLSEEAQWPAPLHDIKAALRWMRANAAELGIDPKRIAVSGNSSGGHLALLAAGTQNRKEFEGNGGNPSADTDISAVISFYAPTELTPKGPMLRQFVDEFMGDATSDADYAAASPLSYATSDFPPTLFLQSNKDEMVPRDQSTRMCDALVKAGAPAEMHLFDHAPHDFDTDPVLARHSVAMVITFLQRYMPATEISNQ